MFSILMTSLIDKPKNNTINYAKFLGCTAKQRQTIIFQVIVKTQVRDGDNAIVFASTAKYGIQQP